MDRQNAQPSERAGTTIFVIATPIPESANTCYFGPVNRRLIIPFLADPLGPKTSP